MTGAAGEAVNRRDEEKNRGPSLFHRGNPGDPVPGPLEFIALWPLNADILWAFLKQSGLTPFLTTGHVATETGWLSAPVSASRSTLRYRLVSPHTIAKRPKVA